MNQDSGFEQTFPEPPGTILELQAARLVIALFHAFWTFLDDSIADCKQRSTRCSLPHLSSHALDAQFTPHPLLTTMGCILGKPQGPEIELPDATALDGTIVVQELWKHPAKDKQLDGIAYGGRAMAEAMCKASGMLMPPTKDGKFFMFRKARLEELLDGCRCAASDGWGNTGVFQSNARGACATSIKAADTRFEENDLCLAGGDGAVFRATLTRDGKEIKGRDKSIIFQANGKKSEYGIGCWNPCGGAAEGDFQVGDVIHLTDFQGGKEGYCPAELGAPLPTKRKLHSKTGWNLKAKQSSFGRTGLVGAYWAELEISFTLDPGKTVTAIRTDHEDENQRVVRAKNEDGTWTEVNIKSTKDGLMTFAEPVETREIKIAFKGSGASPCTTKHSGGGSHFEVMGK